MKTSSMHSGVVTSHPPSAIGSSEVLVRVEGVSKKFCRSLKRSLWYGVCDIAGELNPFTKHGARGTERGEGSTQGVSNQLVTSLPKGHLAEPRFSPPVTPNGLRSGEFWAVDDVSFELRRGERLGIIGHNGAGKTTLLRMLNGLIKPDRGRIEINGRVSALIALGAGFNPILTGRENIYINGAVLGLSKQEVEEKIEEIIDFSEIGSFIDVPVQSYSSGMAVRLGFSVASALNPDVLILDEVLAVGDIRFVVKCVNRLRDAASNAAVILVSHNMQTIAGFCTRVLMMQSGGAVIDTTKPVDAALHYFDSVKQTVADSGVGGGRVVDCEIQIPDGGFVRGSPIVPRGASGTVCLDFEVHDRAEAAELLIFIADLSGAQIMAFPVLDSDGLRKVFPPGKHRIHIATGTLELSPGKYSITVILRSPKNNKIWIRTEGLAAFRVSDENSYGAAVTRPVFPNAWTCKSETASDDADHMC